MTKASSEFAAASCGPRPATAGIRASAAGPNNWLKQDSTTSAM
ncbi:hypothetical protein OG607_01505 [Streptomyces sp. NBC_01537]